METYTKTELLTAQGPFYQADPSWRKKIEEWTADGVLRTAKDVQRSHCGRTAPHLYNENAVYIAAILFRMRALGLSNTRIRDIAKLLHMAFGPEPDPAQSAPALEYWQAAKEDAGEPETYRAMDRRGHPDPRKWSTPPGSPCELIIGLVPDDGRGFDGELSAFYMFGSASGAPQGYGELRIDLSALFRGVRLPQRPAAAAPRPVGREALSLPPIPQHPAPATVAAVVAQRARRSRAPAAKQSA